MNLLAFLRYNEVIRKGEIRMYWLKKEDLPLILFDIEKGSYGDQSIHIRWMSERTEDLPEMISDESSLEAWIQHRMIPRNRAFVEEILASQGLKYKDMEGLITLCKGLSETRFVKGVFI